MANRIKFRNFNLIQTKFEYVDTDRAKIPVICIYESSAYLKTMRARLECFTINDCIMRLTYGRFYKLLF